MQILRLNLGQVRAFEQATFDFKPGMNLIIGINGVGKSTVLDVLRIALSQSLPKITASKSKALPFQELDIMMERPGLTVELKFEAYDTEFIYTARKQREQYIVDKQREGEVRDQTIPTPDLTNLSTPTGPIAKTLRTAPEQPFALFFSSRRSLAILGKKSVNALGNHATAFADALTNRELRVREFADWWLFRKTLWEEAPRSIYGRQYDVIQDVLVRFLDDIGRVHVEEMRDSATLLLEKNGVKLDISQLSDGERGMLALVMDIARRLAQANPKMRDPIRDGKAVVLIDELDLHLHPRWQRTIVEKLTTTFPNCQFIATTHSPQIVGEVQPESIIILENGKPRLLDQSLGMDSNWVLRYLMGTEDRNVDTNQKLEQISELIENEAFTEAQNAVNKLRDELGDFSELVRLQTRLDRLQILGK